MWKSRLVLGLSIIATILFAVSCGGGGNSGSSPTPTPTPPPQNLPALGTVDSTNAQQIGRAFAQSLLGIRLGIEPLGDLASFTNIACLTTYVNQTPVTGTYTKTYDPITFTGSQVFSNCTLAKSISYDGTIQISNISLMNPYRFTIHFNNLHVNYPIFGAGPSPTLVYDFYLNGDLTVTENASSSDSYNVTASNFTVKIGTSTHTFYNISTNYIDNHAVSDSTLAITMNMTSTDFTGRFDVTTPVIISKNIAARFYPYTGQVKFAGDANSEFSLIINGDENYATPTAQITTDINGVTTDMGWTDLDTWLSMPPRLHVN